MRGVTSPAAWLGRTAQGYAAVLRSENLRRSQIAWAGAVTAEWAFFVGVGVFAFERGGTVGVGLVGLIRMAPAAAVAPFAALLGDRYRRDRVALGLFLAMAAAVAVAALVVFVSPPTFLIYALAGVHAAASTLSRSAQWALMPSLSRTPEELVAANGSTLTTENLGTLAGPALAGLVLSGASVGSLFTACAAAYALSAIALARIRLEEGPTESGRRRSVGELLAGFPALTRGRNVRLIVTLFYCQGLVRGALNVYVVIVAFRLVHTGESGVGFLTGALGIGGLVGAIGSLTLSGRRLAAPFAVGLVLWGVPLAVLGAWPDTAIALLAVAVVGAGNSIADVAGFTLMQRLIPDALLNRALGVFWGGAMATVAGGSIAVAGLVAGLGIRGSLAVTGAFLPVLTVLAWRRLAAIDHATAAPTDRLAILDGVPMFAPLSIAAKDRLVSALELIEVPAGTEIIREGEAGDRFYIVVDGEADVSQDGRQIMSRGPRDYFGEIALLRDVPRTATVRARSPMRLYALDRDHFLSAVAGHTAGREAGDAVVSERLAALPTR